MPLQHTRAPTPTVKRTPRQPGRYEVRSLIGRGGGGSVWLAWDPELGREVALKRIDGSEGWPPERRAGLLAEARVTARLEHPAIVPVYDAGLDVDGAVFYVMRRVRGRTLRAVLLDGSWSLQRRLGAFLRVCEGVAYAHAQGVVHGDLKPENVMVGAFGEVMVMDWGAAGDPEMGTPAYMAPECGEARSTPADVWSLGMLLAELGGAGAPELSPLLAKCQADPGERPSAAALAEAVGAWLDGTERRAAADAHATRADAAFAALLAERRTLVALREQEGTLRAATPPWASIHDKAPLLATRAAAQRAERVCEVRMLELANEAERALLLSPGHAAARRILAQVWWQRLDEAEAKGDRREAAFCVDRVRAFEDTDAVRALDSGGMLRVDALGPGESEVFARQWDTDALPWSLGPALPLGVPPLERELPAGSWLLSDGRSSAPMVLRRARRTVLSLPRSEAPEGAVIVPAGSFRVGGDPAAGQQLPAAEPFLETFAICRNLVTMGEYLEFILAIPGAEARLRVPRRSEGPGHPSTPYWRYDGRWDLPEIDGDGDAWSALLPVFAVSWWDACAYARWRGVRDGIAWRLPTDLEWEKAARGVDGRFFPWGDEFEASLCHMNASRPGRPQPVEVGTTPGDRSPYGVCDLAGLVREWCSDADYNGDPSRRPVRGGCWNGSARICRAANRVGYDPGTAEGNIGFRLAAPA